MRFVVFHLYQGGKEVAINTDLIEAVSPEGSGTSIQVNQAPIVVRESYSEVMDKLKGI